MAYCNEDPVCVAADIRYPDPFLPFLEENVTYVCYNFYGSLKNVAAQCKTDNINERCYDCLAYDIRPDLVTKEEFVCTTFSLAAGYDEAENFDTQCDTTGASKEWCFRKDDCMREDLTFLDNGCCRFNHMMIHETNQVTHD